MTMLAVGVVITAFLWRAMTDMEHRLDKWFDRLERKVDGLATDYGSLAHEVAEIRKRTARPEELFKGFIRREPPADAPAAE